MFAMHSDLGPCNLLADLISLDPKSKPYEIESHSKKESLQVVQTKLQKANLQNFKAIDCLHLKIQNFILVKLYYNG